MESKCARELKEFLHMKQGDGEFSYANNTNIQRSATYWSKPIIEKGITSLLSDEIIKPDDQILRVADLGSGVGPIPLGFISTIIENVQKKCNEFNWGDNQLPELQLYLNDLPSNDFNLLFKDMAVTRHQEQPHSRMLRCFTMGVPGSFHGRLFLAIVCTSCILTLLCNGSLSPVDLKNEGASQVNKSNIYVSETSAPTWIKTYIDQYKKDWTSFLSYRSEEMVVGGRVVLVVPGRPSLRLQPILELFLLGQAIASLVSQGLIKEEDVDTCNFPAYCPSSEEIQEVVQEEGSFEIEHIQTVVHEIVHEVEDNYEKAKTIGKCIRSFSESVISHHFGKEVLDKLYSEVIQVTFKYLANEPAETSSIIVLLRKRLSIPKVYIPARILK